MSLAATEEQLRDLLKQHGVGDKDLSSRVSVVLRSCPTSSARSVLSPRLLGRPKG